MKPHCLFRHIRSHDSAVFTAVLNCDFYRQTLWRLCHPSLLKPQPEFCL
jgi:hypothetical protein